MSDPLVLMVPGSKMGLVRMGASTALAQPGVAPTYLGECTLVDASADHIQVPVVIHRVSYTTLRMITSDDAEKCGYRHQALKLIDALIEENPRLRDDSPVTLFEWRLARDLEPPEAG